MSREQIISWIFLATAYATQSSAAEVSSISLLADGINHSVPTHAELQTAMEWLTRHDWVAKHGSAYSLTTVGKSIVERAATQSATTNGVWKILEHEVAVLRPLV